MLTKRQNFLETIRGGKPDRFVNQFEFLQMLDGGPIAKNNARPNLGEIVANAWGIYFSWPEGTPGSFPMHDPEHVVIKDVTKWRDYVKAPRVVYPAEDWAAAVKIAESVDRNEVFACAMVAPGIFEQCHHLMGIDVCLKNLYIEPEAMHELIDYLVEYELAIAAEYIKYLKPDALYHHDDWGTQLSSFMSPAMFDEFYLPAYKKVYGFYKDNGVELIVHHSDSYAANLVPEMIEMKMDVFQGCMTTNNVPELVKKYGGKISFMGDLDNGVLDRHNTTDEKIREEVLRACRNNGKHYFIPCLVRGGPASNYPGVYERVSAEIAKVSVEMADLFK